MKDAKIFEDDSGGKILVFTEPHGRTAFCLQFLENSSVALKDKEAKALALHLLELIEGTSNDTHQSHG